MLQRYDSCTTAVYETRELNTKHRVILRGRELQTPLFTLSQFQTYKYDSSQGGVLSPILFDIYMDNLIKRLKYSNIGYKVGKNM